MCVILVPSTMTVSILSRTPQSRWFFEISIFLFDFSFRIVIVEPSSFSESLSVSWSAWDGKSNQIFAAADLDVKSQMVTSQELPMLSSVIFNCQVTIIVMNSGSQLSRM